MTAIPVSVVDPTVAAIYAAYESRREWPRAHLGASVLGRPCERQLWYAFRWAYAEQFDGRMLRLFERGKREEAIFAADLRAIGVQMNTVDPRTGRQFEFSVVGGHVGGSCDGVASGFKEAPKALHVVEFKTHSAKSFAELRSKGVQEAKPDHWMQCQLYMRWASIDRAFYLAVNKDTDELYAERLRFDAAAAERLEAKAARIVQAPEQPDRISNDPSWYQCKLCPARQVCHQGEGIAVTCRTCVHATPELDGNARWSCARWDADIPDLEAQRAGCTEHRLIPALLTWAKAVDASPEENWIEYESADGVKFRNGGGGYASSELAVGWHSVVLGSDPAVAKLRAQGMRIIEARATAADEPERQPTPSPGPYLNRPIVDWSRPGMSWRKGAV